MLVVRNDGLERNASVGAPLLPVRETVAKQWGALMAPY